MIISHKSPTAGARINAERDEQIGGGFEWGGYVFDTDAKSLTLINGRVSKITAIMAMNDTPADFVWRTSDNQDYVFTPTEFLQFAVALDDWIEGEYVDSWTKKSAL